MKPLSEMLDSVPWPRAKARERALVEFARTEGNVVPSFTEIPSGFEHREIHPLNAFPVVDVVAVDVTRSGTPALIVTGGLGQHNAVLVVEDRATRDVAYEFGLEGLSDRGVYGITVADIDNDGEDEIVMAEHTGIAVYSRGPGETKYERTELDVELADRSLPLAVAFGDTRGTGHLDMYVSTFIDPNFLVPAIYNDPSVSVDNKFFRNNGDGTFVDASEESGLGFHQNCFDARFVDFTGDGLPDLVAAFNTDRPRLWGNNGDGTFSEKMLPGGWGFWMGLAIGDTTGNGLPDIFFANAGKSLPVRAVRKDLRDDQESDLASRHLRNDGDYKFTDITAKTKATSQAFAWGSLFADFTNNGRLDLVITENYLAYPLGMHKYLPTAGKLLVQGVDGTFLRAEAAAGVRNFHFGYRPIAADLTGSGSQDLIIANIAGPLRIFLNDL